MAIYRQIQVSYWQDEFVTELMPEEKYFYLYLMTNDKTSQCGVYRFNKRVVAFDTGWTVEKVEEMLLKFVEYGRIEYNPDAHEIFLKNWLKYNKARSPKVATVVDRELKDIKTIEYHNQVIELCIQYGYPIKTEKIPYPYPIDTVPESPDTVPIPNRNNNQNNNQNKNNNQNQNNEVKNSYAEKPAPAAANIFTIYEENFGMLKPLIIDSLEHWEEDIGPDLLIEAMRRASLDNKQFSYAEGIMKRWVKANIKTLADVKAEDVAFNNRKNSNVLRTKKENVPDWAENSAPATETPLDPDEERLINERIARLKTSQKREA